MTFSRIKILPCFNLVTVGELNEHGVIIRSIVACDMTNLSHKTKWDAQRRWKNILCGQFQVGYRSCITPGQHQ